MSARYLSPGFWRRAVMAYGVDGVIDAGLRSLRVRKRSGGETATDLDLTGRTEDPVEALYLGAGQGLTPVIQLPMSHLRTEKLGVAVDDLQSNPFSRTVHEFLTKEHVTYSGSTLQQFLDGWRPRSVAEFLGVTTDADLSPLNDVLETVFFPWERPLSHDAAVAKRLAEERSWILKFGPSSTGCHGSSHYGPASEALGEYRFEKHTRVAASIAADEVNMSTNADFWWDPRRGGYVEAQLLVDGPTRRVVVREGKHRTAALAALGVGHIVLALPLVYPVVRRDDVESWPGVAGGWFTAGEALSVFDRFMEGKLPGSVLEQARVVGDAAS